MSKSGEDPPRHHAIDDAAQREGGQCHARRQRATAAAMQPEQRRHERKYAEEQHAFRHDRANDHQRQRIGQHRRIGDEGAQEGRPHSRNILLSAQEGEDHDERRGGDECRNSEDRTPAERRRQHARAGAAGHVPGDRDDQHPAQRQMPLRIGNPVADQGEGDRNDPAGATAGNDATGEHALEAGSNGADRRADDDAGERQADQLDLADRVGGRPQDDLHQRIGKAIGRGEQRRPRQRHLEIGSNDRQHGVERAQRDRARKRGKPEAENQTHPIPSARQPQRRHDTGHDAPRA